MLMYLKLCLLQFREAHMAGWNFTVLTPVFSIHWGFKERENRFSLKPLGLGRDLRRNSSDSELFDKIGRLVRIFIVKSLNKFFLTLTLKKYFCNSWNSREMKVCYSFPSFILCLSNHPITYRLMYSDRQTTGKPTIFTK